MGVAPTIDFSTPIIFPLTLQLQVLVLEKAMVFQQPFAPQPPFSLLSPLPFLLAQPFGPQLGSPLSTRCLMRLTQGLFLPDLVLELSARILRKDIVTI